MSQLTTFAIYNDGCSLIKDNPNRFANKLYEACIDGSPNVRTISIGGFSNLIEVKPTRHADDCTIYVHRGNCLTEVNQGSKEFRNIARNHPEIALDMIRFLERELKSLRAMVQGIYNNEGC